MIIKLWMCASRPSFSILSCLSILSFSSDFLFFFFFFFFSFFFFFKQTTTRATDLGLVYCLSHTLFSFVFPPPSSKPFRFPELSSVLNTFLFFFFWYSKLSVSSHFPSSNLPTLPPTFLPPSRPRPYVVFYDRDDDDDDDLSRASL